MKIALFDSEATLDGAQRFLLDLAGGLLARRWEVVAVLGAEGPLRKALTQGGIPVTVIPFPEGRGRWKAIPRLAAFFHREGACRLVANSLPAALYGGLAMRLAGGRACRRLYLPGELTIVRSRARLAARICAQVHAAFPLSPEELHALPGHRARLRVLPPGIDLSAFPAHKLPAMKRNERPVIGIIDYWEPANGQDMLVKAFRLLHATGVAARLRLASPVGCSAEQERYRAMVESAVKASGLADRIIFEGEITDLPGFLARCHVVVAPSLGETTGRLALEAAAIGRPVIASRIPNLSEIVEDGHTGLLVPPNDPRAMADALALLLATPALRAEMGRQARLHAESTFALGPYLDALEDHFLGKPTEAWEMERENDLTG